jgi:hypothetical protein
VFRRLIIKINAAIRLPNIKKTNLIPYHYYSDFSTPRHVSFVIKNWDKQSSLAAPDWVPYDLFCLGRVGKNMSARDKFDVKANVAISSTEFCQCSFDEG